MIFGADPSMDPYVSPYQQSAFQGQALLNLGLGLMAGGSDRLGFGHGVASAFQGAQQNYNDAMDRAFRNTLMKQQADYQQKERDLQLQQQDVQLKQAQRTEREQASQTAQRLSTGITSASDPAAYWNLVQNSPEVTSALSTLGIQAPYIGPLSQPGNFDAFKQQLATAGTIGAPAQQPIKLSAGDVLLQPGTYQPIASAAPKSTVEYKDAGDKLIPVNSVSGQVVPGLPPIPKSLTPDQERGQFAPAENALLAALADRGVSLPAGLRSKEQQKATISGLLARHPEMTPDQIADGVRTGQLDFNGAKRSTGQLATLSAAADVQSTKIEKDLASLGPIIDRLPGGPARIAAEMTNLQKNWSWKGDKDTTQAVGYIKELSGEYAKLVSGSAGMAAPPEGEMKAALSLMQSALTKNGYEGMREFLTTTSQNRRDSVKEGLQRASALGAGVGNGPSAIPKAAPAAAITYLLSHPEMRAQFKAKYGYLPGGFQ